MLKLQSDECDESVHVVMFKEEDKGIFDNKKIH